MTRSTASRNSESHSPRDLRRNVNRILMMAVAAIVLACAPQAALAQHGGGGHGGGGGGGHFGGGGGGHIGGGAGHYGGGIASFGGSHGSQPMAGMHSGGSPSGGSIRPGTPPLNFGRDNPAQISRSSMPTSFARPVGPAGGQASSMPQRVTIGFPHASMDNGFATPGTAITGAGAQGTSAWRPITPIRDGGGTVLSFSGQGHEIWMNSPSTASKRPGGGSNESESLESRPYAQMRPRAFPPRRFRGGFFGSGYGYSYGYGGFYPYWGFGLGFGFGSWCDPTWDFNCYSYYVPYAPGYYAWGDDSAATADNSQDYGVYSAPDDLSNTNATGPTVLYLNDGTSFTVSDYWVADYQLHYVTEGAREGALDLNQIDVQRTVDENAARGMNFTLKPTPGAAPTQGSGTSGLPQNSAPQPR